MPDFSGVARSLAKGESPPDWLIPVLARFGEFISFPLDDDDDTIERELFRSAEYLHRMLPMYVEAYAITDAEPPECISTVLLHLPDLLVFLAKELLHKGDTKRRVCAAVCAETWRILHGAIEPHSTYLQRACDEYWRACGQEPIGRKLENGPRNWERSLLWVVAEDDQGFRSQIEQMSHTKPVPE
jgi:hypothetical protein